MTNMVFTISGMSCGHCLNAVNKALASVPGVQVNSVRVGRAEVALPSEAERTLVKAAIEKAGYKVDAVTAA
jgi:copper chaperone